MEGGARRIMTMITGSDDIAFAQMLARKGALRLETLGMKVGRGRTMYSVIKEQYGLKGNKQSVYTQFCELVETEKRKRGI